MVTCADNPLAPNLVTIFWINFDVEMIDHATECHDNKQKNEYHIMDRNYDQEQWQKYRL